MLNPYLWICQILVVCVFIQFQAITEHELNGWTVFVPPRIQPKVIFIFMECLDSFSSTDESSSSRHDAICGKDWSRLQSVASNHFNLSGSSGNDWSILQRLKSRIISCESCLILAGKSSNLFPLRKKYFSEDRQPISCGIVVKAQSLISSDAKGDKPDNDDAKYDTKHLVPLNQSCLSSFESASEELHLPMFTGELPCSEKPSVKSSHLDGLKQPSRWSASMLFKEEEFCSKLERKRSTRIWHLKEEKRR